ncbi:hypothetical protein ACJMK2_038392 [Sinanodonta woodiana]|uniref:TM2 domain-containing protein n=1 Tax=Sinanodonta woodiana TaxID=1069815 RepID=A0ABD3W9P9_SINWO
MEICSKCLKNLLIQMLAYLFVIKTTTAGSNFTVKPCSELLMGQFWCNDPEIDIETQQAKGCKRETRTVAVPCMPAPEITCLNEQRNEMTFNGTEVGFYKEVPCKWTNGYHFETALLLSIFLGVFGIDRFYLGYPAIGLLKFSTLGFFFLGQLVDVLLIAIQVVKPSDGSDYVIDHYGAGLIRIVMDNDTYIKPEDYS